MLSLSDKKAKLQAQEHESSPDKEPELEAHDEDVLKYWTIGRLDGLSDRGFNQTAKWEVLGQAGQRTEGLARRSFV